MDFFMMCHKLTYKSHHSRFHHGAIVVHRKNRILGKGCNKKQIHAEVSAIMDIPHYKRYKNLVVYVCRVNAQGGFLNSKPCCNCMKFMRENGVSKIYYSDDNGFSKIVLKKQ